MKASLGYLRYFINRALRHFFSIYRWVVMIKRLTPAEVSRKFTPEAGETITLREAVDNDYPALIDAYPLEFSAHLAPELIAKQLRGRQRQGVLCFVALDAEGHICGATWCPPNTDFVIRRAGFPPNRVFEMMNTFVVPEYRGQGVGGALRRFALNEMAERGYQAVISYIWYSRQESLAMNFATGSRLLAEKYQLTVLGWRKVTYGHRIDLSRLPLPEKPGVLVIGESAAERRSTVRLFRRWGAAALSVGPDGLDNQSRFENYANNLTERMTCPPLVFCCDPQTRKRFLDCQYKDSLVAGMLPCEWDEAYESVGVVPPASGVSFPKDLCSLDRKGKGLVALLYLNGIGRKNVISLWAGEQWDSVS